MKLRKQKTHWQKKNRPKLNTTIVVRTLAYERFDHELPNVAGASVPGLKSSNPLALQCQKCHLLVAVLPVYGIDYLISMSYFMQNKIAIENGDRRRLCPACQLDHWSAYLNVLEADDARARAREQAIKIDKRVY